MENALREYAASKQVTQNLTDLILQQEQDISLYDREATTQTVKDLKTAKELHLKSKLDEILNTVDAQTERCLLLNNEKGAGSWLTVLPLKDHGYCLNKVEFKDALALRYGWRIPNTPHFCGCGSKNSVDHTLMCKKGGYVHMRHNALRDLNAELQKEVCRDVVTEPKLIPLDGEVITGATADGACPDVSSRGIWSTFERTFFDVRVLHPNCPSYQSVPMSTLYARHEKEKMTKYNLSN